MKNMYKKSGMVALAAAIALAGCELSDGKPGNTAVAGPAAAPATPSIDTPVEISEENALEVAEAGNELSSDASTLGSVAGAGAPAAPLSRNAALRSIADRFEADIVRKHPRAARKAETVDCQDGGSYTLEYSETGWDVTYDNCESSYEGEGYSNRSVINGHSTGKFVAGDGEATSSWEASYEDLDSFYEYSYKGNDFYSHYLLNGKFESTYSYDAKNSLYKANYGASGLTVEYDYRYMDEHHGDGELVERKGTTIYDTYAFSFWSEYSEKGNRFAWEGDMAARDSNVGAIFMRTVKPFLTDYCAQTVEGEILYSGHAFHDDGAGEGNVLRMIADGSDMVTFEILDSAGNVVSSREEDWFYYDSACG